MSSLKNYLVAFAEPLLLMTVSIYYLAYACLCHPILLLASPTSFRSKWFERMFSFLGPKMAALERQVGYIESVMSRASGVVLELGPGGGDQTFHFKADRIEKIYAVEPNWHLHPALVAKAKEMRMVDKYIPMTAGAQPESLLPALVEAGLLPQNFSKLPEGGVFDSIVTIKSMCSVPSDRLPETMAVLRELLKPGGQFLFFEHLHNDTSFLTQLYASTLNFFLWPALMGGCRLDGNLDKLIMGMSGWQTREIENAPEHQGHEVFRYAMGICTKA